MKKRIITFLLLLCLLLTSVSVPVIAAETSHSAVLAVQALGIMTGNEYGDLMLGSNVTRAQFVTMMTRASAYKDSIGEEGSGFSLFKDVKSSHWASEYIRLAIEEEWVAGYTDGTFRPEKTITLEEACTMVLRLLGYSSENLVGSFPAAQLNKAQKLGLRDQIAGGQGSVMTRLDCAQLFYNALNAKTVNGQAYALTLGYTMNNGEVDYTSVTRDNLSGPFVAEEGEQLPFTPATIYRNGDISKSATLNRYDVYYYHEALSTAWIYTTRIAGSITALTPDSSAPTAVSVAGKTYSLGNASVAYQLSVFGGTSKGDVVTLLLGMDDAVVGIITDEAVETTYYGVVQSSEKKTNADGTSVETNVTVMCTDGGVRTFTVNKSTTYTVGHIVSVNVTGTGVTVRTLTERTLTGKINSEATKLGNQALSASIKILDTTDEGDAVAVKAERLANCHITSSSVRYYVVNEKNEIEHLILENATGDTWTYVYMTSIDDNSFDMNINVTYEYLLNGTELTLRSSGSRFGVTEGGVGFSYDKNGNVRSMFQMDSDTLTDLGVQKAMVGNRSYAIADDVQVYLRKSGQYYVTALSSINAEDYFLTGWRDVSSGDAGGNIRIIIATEK